MFSSSLVRVSIVLAIAMTSGPAVAQMQRGERRSSERERAELPNPLTVVRFGSGSIRLDARDRRALAGAAVWLDEHPHRLLILEGHADSRGSLAANLTLSQRRTDVVRDELVRLGADPLRMVGAAYGELEPTGTLVESRRVVVRGTEHPYAELVYEQRAPDLDEELEPAELEEPEVERRGGGD